MAVLQKVKINNEWVPVSGSNVNSGGGGITEEKEVYIGTDTPTDDGAKLWIDTDDESGGEGGGTSGGLNVYTFPVAIGNALVDAPYEFSPEESAEFLRAISIKNTLYLLTFVGEGMAQSLPLSFVLIDDSTFQAQAFAYTNGYMSVSTIHLTNTNGTISGYFDAIVKKL